ncbi:MAG: glycosyltransferase [Chloroflexi bacterium]|nr:glycosyltransferase [Chloroflexota bacterium]
MRIAYMMSRFPKLTETFVLYEMLAVEEEGVDIEIYPLMREKTPVVQAEAEAMVKRAHFTPFFSAGILVANARYMLTQPKTYFRTLWTAIKANLGSTRFLLGNLAYFPKAAYLARLMTENNIQHIHAHFASFPAAVAYMIHQFTDIPYSFTAHGSDLHRDQHMLCEKIAASKATVAISEYNRKIMIDCCGEQHASKIYVIHCGINLERFYSDKRDETNQNLSIICIGSLHEVKGQRYLIEACGKLKERGIPFNCHFVGDGDDRDALQQLVLQLGIGEQVHFHGRLTQAEVIERLKMANVAALNSVPSSDGRREGIPVALMEAMAFGLPVVSTRLSGIPELVGEDVTGFLTEPGDSEAIAEALARLADNPQLRLQFGRAGRVKIEAEFELHSNAQRLVALINGVL